MIQHQINLTSSQVALVKPQPPKNHIIIIGKWKIALILFIYVYLRIQIITPFLLLCSRRVRIMTNSFTPHIICSQRRGGTHSIVMRHSYSGHDVFDLFLTTLIILQYVLHYVICRRECLNPNNRTTIIDGFCRLHFWLWFNHPRAFCGSINSVVFEKGCIFFDDDSRVIFFKFCNSTA